MLERYKTILNEAEAEIVEKKSRFIAAVKPVKTEEEAREFIEAVKKRHWNATHNVFAYQIGARNELARFSDDGEPQGTAGMPVLSVLSGEDIKNTVVVVTRYFGGTLLGTGGLVRAYSKAAKAGLLAGEIAEMIYYRKYSVKCDYTLSGKIQYEIMDSGHLIKDTIYTDKVEYVVIVEASRGEEFEKAVSNVSSGRCEAEKTDENYAAWVNGELKMLVL